MIVLSNVVAPTVGIRISQPQVAAFIENERCGQGELIISEGSVTWVSDQSQQGFSLTYHSIILHAVSRDDSVFPDECLYVLVDASKSERRRQKRAPELLFTDISEDFGNIGLGPEKNATKADVSSDLNAGGAAGSSHNGMEGASQNGGDNEEEAGTEVAVRFVPMDKSILSRMYEQMCECQALNPDEEDDFSDEAGENDEFVEPMVGDEMGQGDGRWFTAENENAPELSAEGMANLQRIMAASEQHAQNVDGFIVMTSESDNAPVLSAEGMEHLQRLMAASQQNAQNGHSGSEEEQERMDE